MILGLKFTAGTGSRAAPGLLDGLHSRLWSIGAWRSMRARFEVADLIANCLGLYCYRMTLDRLLCSTRNVWSWSDPGLGFAIHVFACAEASARRPAYCTCPFAEPPIIVYREAIGEIPHYGRRDLIFNGAPQSLPPGVANARMAFLVLTNVHAMHNLPPEQDFRSACSQS